MPANTAPQEAFSDAWFDEQDDNWAANKANFAAHEAAQERAAYRAKMERDRALAAQNRPAAAHRGTRAQNIGSDLDTTVSVMAGVQTQTSANLTAGRPRINDSNGQPLGKLKPGERKFEAKHQSYCIECRATIEPGTLVAGRKEGRLWKLRHFPVCPEKTTPTIVNPQALRRRMITPGQAQLIADLQVERGVPRNPLDETTTFAEASALIGELIKMPRVSRQKRTVELNGLPEGRYAVPTEDGAENKLAFYNVTERGVFLQLSDALHPVPQAVEQAIIAKILLDPAEAARTYGRELGACGVCGRTLTNDVSRGYGIGPVCRKNTGW